MKIIFPNIFSCLLIIIFISCGVENQITENNKTLDVQLAESPDHYLPFCSVKNINKHISSLTVVPLARYNPLTDNVEKYLLETSTSLENNSYSLKCRNAVWSDGELFSMEDLWFTLKVLQHPDFESPYKKLYDFITEVHSISEREGEVRIKGFSFAQQELLDFLYPMPSHFWDKEGIFENVGIQSSFWDTASTDLKAKTAIIIESIQKNISSLSVPTLGPYKITTKNSEKWQFEKINNHWTNNLPNWKPNVEKISFQFIKLAATREALMRDNSLDVVSGFSIPVSTRMENDDAINYNTVKAQNPVVYYFPFNLKDPILSDIKVREALRRTIPIQLFIEKVLEGNAKQVATFFHPKSLFFNAQVDIPKLDIDKAKLILSESGWSDNDGDNILDKKGKKLIVEILLRKQSKEGMQLVEMWKDNAEKAGIQLKIKLLDARTINSLVKKGEFQMYSTASVTPLKYYDPSSRWHSQGKRNLIGYANDSVDLIINEILDTKLSDEALEKRYFDIQELVSKDIPAIFLYTKESTVFYKDDWTAPITSLESPGYYIKYMTRK